MATKYRVTDTDSPLFEKCPIIEAKSPKEAVERLFGKVECSQYGHIVATRLSHPFRSYTYQCVD